MLIKLWQVLSYDYLINRIRKKKSNRTHSKTQNKELDQAQKDKTFVSLRKKNPIDIYQNKKLKSFKPFKKDSIIEAVKTGNFSEKYIYKQKYLIKCYLNTTLLLIFKYVLLYFEIQRCKVLTNFKQSLN